MNESIVTLITSVSDENLTTLTVSAENQISESRAKALLLAANALDEPTLNDFRKMMASPKVIRVAIGDLMDSASWNPSPRGEGAISTPDWLALAVNAFAQKAHYDVEDLDPSAPPSQHSPAGQVVHHTAAWVRRQVSRSTIDREKMARLLAFREQSIDNSQHLTANGVADQPPAARPLIPIQHFEYNEPVSIDPDEPLHASTPVQRADAISITPGDLREPEDEIRIVGDSQVVPRPVGVPVPGPQPSRIGTAVRQSSRQASSYVRENVTRENVQAVTQRVVSGTESVFNTIRDSIGESGGDSGEIGRTRLRVTVMDYPNGHSLPAVQTMVRYTGSRKEVAGATANDGEFIVSLPARQGNGLTYEVTIHWPPEFGNKPEKKRITVHPDRPEFQLAFYSRLVP